MTPKEKALELVWKYYSEIEHTISDEYAKVDWKIAESCALIAVDEIIPLVESYEEALGAAQRSDAAEYWQEVKQEIEKL